jgi:hypothetical protein
MADKGLSKTRGAYLLAKIYFIFFKGATMAIFGVDAEEEVFVDDN